MPASPTTVVTTQTHMLQCLVHSKCSVNARCSLPLPRTNAVTALVVSSAGEDVGSQDSTRLLVEPQGQSPFGEPWQSRES